MPSCFTRKETCVQPYNTLLSPQKAFVTSYTITQASQFDKDILKVQYLCLTGISGKKVTLFCFGKTLVLTQAYNPQLATNHQ